jgi:hypothetical protein
MMTEQIVTAAALLASIAIVAWATLRGWQGWLSFKQQELERAPVPRHDTHWGSPIGAARIEISDLKERIRKLEAIASGVDL